MRANHLSYVREIVEHPRNRDGKLRAFGRYLRWNLGRRLLSEADYAIELAPGVRIVLSNRENYATLAYTCGLYDYDDMRFMLDFLRPGDCFGDFGANVGVYSVLAASTGAHVLSVEPVPDTYRRLCANLRLNDARATPVNCGLSDRAERLAFTVDRGGMNKVAKHASQTTCEVDVTTADALADSTGLRPRLVKIDVEGYEYPLLAGARRLLDDSVCAIIIEMNESGREYGHSDDSVHELLRSQGFSPYRYAAAERLLERRPGINRESFNTLYIKDRDATFVGERVRGAAS